MNCACVYTARYVCILSYVNVCYGNVDAFCHMIHVHVRVCTEYLSEYYTCTQHVYTCTCTCGKRSHVHCTCCDGETFYAHMYIYMYMYLQSADGYCNLKCIYSVHDIVYMHSLYIHCT